MSLASEDEMNQMEAEPRSHIQLVQVRKHKKHVLLCDSVDIVAAGQEVPPFCPIS
jgi:hypothetical protein